MPRTLLVLLLLTLPALSCLNETEKDLNGNDVPVEVDRGRVTELGYYGRNWKYELAEHEQALRVKPDDRGALNDRGVCLAHLRRSREALAIFQKMEKEAPGSYATAANLGTCYELCGQDENALHWIRIGIQRNPKSHEGTEWLHVKILEAKLALAKDPDWLKSHSVLGLDFGSDLRPKFPPELASRASRDRVRKALRYQLDERMPLVAPPDPVVGDLLFDLGNLAALMQSAHRGEEVMEQSLRYRSTHQRLAKKRLAYFASFDKEEPETEPKPKSKSPAKKTGAQVGRNWWRPALAVVGLLGLLLGLGRFRR